MDTCTPMRANDYVVFVAGLISPADDTWWQEWKHLRVEVKQLDNPKVTLWIGHKIEEKGTP